MSDKAPVAIFAFNRPEKLKRLIESLLGCEEAAKTHFYIYIDGPRNAEEASLVATTKAIAESSSLGNVVVKARDTNLGLRNSIYSGVSEVVGRHGKVIVLEDDLVLSPIALAYFNEALDYYRDEERVWSICGYLHDAPSLRSLGRTLLLPMTQSWGWATWGRAWSRFDLDARPSEATLQAASFARFFDVNGMVPFTRMLRTSLAGLVSSWYVHWNYTVFANGGYSVFPPQRVLGNAGIGAGTHGGKLNPHSLLIKAPPLLTQMPRMTPPGEIDYPAVDELVRCREARAQRMIIFAGYVKRTIKHLRRKTAAPRTSAL